MIEVALSAWQHDSIFNVDQYPLLYICGGRGSGKSYTDAPRIIRWSELSTELPWAIIAATDLLLQTVLAPIARMVEEMGYDHVYASEAPAEWRESWRANNIPFPPKRLRNVKFWIWEDATHIYTGSVINNAYTRAKGIDFNGILFQEGTEPGVEEDAVDTLVGNLRCGKARRQKDGTYRCMEPGHLHQLVYVFNVPLNDPSHFIYRKVDRLKKVNEKLRAQDKPEIFRLIECSTFDNPVTGENYVEILRANWDEPTFIQQTSGRLERNQFATSYYRFSAGNVIDTPTYDRDRDLHLWFDFNHAPGTAGFGHDLRYDEVPEAERRAGYNYFAIVGELHSGGDTFLTEQVANALLEDPLDRVAFKNKRCKDCPHHMGEHVEMHDSWLCKQCHHQTKRGVFCSGATATLDERSTPQARGYIHAAGAWRGLAKHRGLIYVYGDPSGKQTHADSSVIGGSRQILRDIFAKNLGERVFFRFAEAQPAINMRVLAVNRGFCDGRGIRSLYVHPACEAHLADFREVVPGKDGTPKKEQKPTKPTTNTYWQRTHLSDGFGYMVHYRWPPLEGAELSFPSMVQPSDLPPFASLGRP